MGLGGGMGSFMPVKKEPRRPLVDVQSGVFVHNGTSVRVVLRRDKISVGCTDVTPEALRKLLQEYDKQFCTKNEVVLQAY